MDVPPNPPPPFEGTLTLPCLFSTYFPSHLLSLVDVHGFSHGFTLQHIGQPTTRTLTHKNTNHTGPLLLSMLKKIAKTNVRTPTPSTYLPRGARLLMCSLIKIQTHLQLHELRKSFSQIKPCAFRSMKHVALH